MAKKGLGRGLDALIPITNLTDISGLPSGASATTGSQILFLKINEITANRYQPRREFSEEKLAELVASIREKGVIQPILVHRLDGKYELIAGERRWRAATELGLAEIPAIVKEVSDIELLELSLIENIQREDLNPVEEAMAYRQLINEFNFRQEDIALKVGKDRSSISNCLRLLKLPSEIQAALQNGAMAMGHARALLALPSPKLMQQLAKRIINDGLSVRETEKLVKELAGFGKKNQATPKAAGPVTNAHLVALEDELKDIFSTKVVIRKSGKRKRIEFEYYTDDDLERLLHLFRQFQSAP